MMKAPASFQERAHIVIADGVVADRSVQVCVPVA